MPVTPSTAPRIESDLNWSDLIDGQARQIMALVAQHINELGQTYYGHRPIGSDDVRFPCVMVEPAEFPILDMDSTGKYLIHTRFAVYWYDLQSDRDVLTARQTQFASALAKLFSNSALEDGSNRFKQNTGFWINSVMRAVTLSPTFVYARPDRSAYIRAGKLTLECWDRRQL